MMPKIIRTSNAKIAAMIVADMRTFNLKHESDPHIGSVSVHPKAYGDSGYLRVGVTWRANGSCHIDHVDRFIKVIGEACDLAERINKSNITMIEFDAVL